MDKQTLVAVEVVKIAALEGLEDLVSSSFDINSPTDPIK
jgi:hypothetical protein